MKFLQRLRHKLGGRVDDDRAITPESEQTHARLAVEAPTSIKRRGHALRDAGQWEEAAQCYARAASLVPDDVDARIQLGFVFAELGRADSAFEHLAHALTLDPMQADAHYLLGTIELQRDRTAAAIDHFRAALAARPLFERCRLALCQWLFAAADKTQAEAVIREGLTLQPEIADFHFYLGNLRLDAADLPQAALSFERATAFAADHDAARRGLARVQQERGDWDAALATLRQIRRPDASDGERYASLATLFHQAAMLEQADACYRAAVRFAPTHAIAHRNLACVLHSQGQSVQAVEHCRTAVAIDPGFAAAHDSLAMALHAQGQFEAAIASARRAIELEPDNASFHSNLGMGLHRSGKLVAAEASYRRALALDGDGSNAHINLGCLLQEQGDHEAAAACLGRALALAPGHPVAMSNLLFTINYSPDRSARSVFETYLEYDRQFGQPLRSEWRVHANPRTTDRRLKIGYVSPDFRHHALRHFAQPLLAHHDKSQVEVYAYSELAAEDAVTRIYRGHADHWLQTTGLSDDTLAERIRSDGIDILVDLAGHTTGNRLGVFARKPAPVSASWLGYGYTTGLGAIDYFLTDSVGVPPEFDSIFAETPWRLATPGYAYRPDAGMGDVSPLPALARGHVTFGTLTRAVRINHRTIRVWSQILQRVPRARLVIDSETFRDAAMRQRVADRFGAHDIDASRLEFGFHSPPWDVLRGIDIGLDCFPHNSGTTLFESLYMGVPFVTLADRPSVGRLGSSILHGLGHPEWITNAEDDYVERAVELASDLPRLTRLRAGLRDEMEASPIRDEAGFARKVEAAFREMVALWAAGTKPSLSAERSPSP